MEKEIWKSIVGYIDSYEVSNLGRVRSLDRYVKSKNGSFRRVKGMILKLKKERDGYRIGLTDDGHQKFYWVHRLVAVAFLENPKKLECVYHKNLDIYDNNEDNLGWASREEILELSKYANSLSGKYRKLNNHRSKKVVVDGKEYDSQSEAARVLNVDLGSLNHAVHRRYGYNKVGGRVIKKNK